eukprot:7927036-Prorocentrum_lima.AAC.1
MATLMSMAKKRVVPYARTRLNIIPNQSQEVSTPRSRLLGAYTIRGCGVAKATFNNDMLDGIHAFARWGDALNGFEYTSAQ